MSFRIIRNDRKATCESDEIILKQEYLQKEAKRYGAFKGGDAKFEEEFITKMKSISAHFSSEDSLKILAKLEKSLKDHREESIQSLGKLEPSIILDLL